MAYSTANPPRLAPGQSVGSTYGREWQYYFGAAGTPSSGDTQANIVAADYFTNALDLGMKPGDWLKAYNIATHVAFITVVTAVVAAGSTCATGTTIAA